MRARSASPSPPVASDDRTLPSFSRPVEIPFAGSHDQAEALAARVSVLPRADHGPSTVVHCAAADGRGRLVGRSWSQQMRQALGSSGVPDRAQHVRKRYDVKPKVTNKTPSGDASRDGDEEQHDDAAPAADAWQPTPRVRGTRTQEAVADHVQDALVACIQRACGRPTAQPLVARASSVTARVVGDKNSRSRAIVLRTGVGKEYLAILWVSCRDGLLCSCFAGTQNALLLSASSRSTKCVHTTALSKALAASGVGIHTFRGRMRLRADAADFAVPDVYGSAVIWALLYRSVYSVVSFSSSNAPACIAPGCRRFRGPCGHVRVAWQRQGPNGFLDIDTGTAPAAVKARLHARKAAAVRRVKVLNNDEEDEGLEKEESDTI